MLRSRAESVAELATEKAVHQRYLRDFRVEQCPDFPKFKCKNHKPYTCFFWHFPNHRRRRPTLTPDGTFNYSPDVYCAKYDAITGVCSRHDDCPFLHRTLGDTERRYHPRYFKTAICVHKVGAQELCLKNGSHCAFAHGLEDMRKPVYGAVESKIQRQGMWLPADSWANFFPEDSSWLDLGFVLLHYKVQPCQRLGFCRMGLACPGYHDRCDRRRNPATHYYSSTPCPLVRRGIKWNDVNRCSEGDQCTFCHGRTEQKFHPDIYKSAMCYDIKRINYCYRGPLCSFAHSENETAQVRIRKTYSTIMSSATSNDPNFKPPVQKPSPASASVGLRDLHMPLDFNPTPGAGRPMLMAPHPSQPKCPSAETEASDQGKDDDRLMEVMSSLINGVFSSVDLPRDVVDVEPGRTDNCYKSFWLTSSSLGSRNVWDQSGILADQSPALPKPCVMCATWKQEVRASARREQLAEEEKQKALAKLSELEKRFNDTTRPETVLNKNGDRARLGT